MLLSFFYINKEILQLFYRGDKMSKQDIVNYVMNTPHNINPAILNQKLGEMEVQPDWNQNDPTALDYIKNRPFYEVVEYPMLTCNLEKGFGNNLVNPDPNFLTSLYANAPKATYIVNGVECQYNQQLGNGTSWFSIRVIGTDGVEYVIGWYNTEGLYASQLSDMTNYRLSATITVPSVNLEAVTVKLDPKYLPTPDLVITISHSLDYKVNASDVDITGGSVEAVCEKLLSGVPVDIRVRGFEKSESYATCADEVTARGLYYGGRLFVNWLIVGDEIRTFGITFNMDGTVKATSNRKVATTEY